MTTITCPRCSKAMPPGVRYCRRCGTSLGGQVVVPPNVSRPVPSPPRAQPAPVTTYSPRQRRRPYIVFAVALAAGVMLVATLLTPRLRVTPAVVATPAQAYRWPTPPGMRVPGRSGPMAAAALPPLPPLPPWSRHLPADLKPARGASDFRGQLLTQERFGDKRLVGAVFAGAMLLQADFERADLRDADFRGAELAQTQLAGADLAGARFDEASIGQSHFVSVDTAAVDGKTRVRDGITEPIPPPPLLVTNAGSATFRKTRFSQTDLDGLDLAGADFTGAVFSSVGFVGCDLSGANLRNSRHQFSDFKDAKLDGADLRGADLSGARNLTAEQLATAKTDATTRLARW